MRPLTTAYTYRISDLPIPHISLLNLAAPASPDRGKGEKRNQGKEDSIEWTASRLKGLYYRIGNE